MAEPKAFAVYDSKMLIGYVGDGPGPVITNEASAMPPPILEHVRYTTVSFRHERVVGPIMAAARDLAAAVKGLTAKGLRLVEVRHAGAFQKP